MCGLPALVKEGSSKSFRKQDVRNGGSVLIPSYTLLYLDFLLTNSLLAIVCDVRTTSLTTAVCKYFSSFRLGYTALKIFLTCKKKTLHTINTYRAHFKDPNTFTYRIITIHVQNFALANYESVSNLQICNKLSEHHHQAKTNMTASSRPTHLLSTAPAEYSLQTYKPQNHHYKSLLLPILLAS